MMVTNPAFEAKINRAGDGRFGSKTNDKPTGALTPDVSVTGSVQVTGYAGEQVRSSTRHPSKVEHGHSMVIADDQVSDVSTFAEEHVLEDGRYLSSVHYVFAASDDEGQTFRTVTETEQFISDVPDAYRQLARRDREGSTWERFDSAPARVSRERAASAAARAANDAYLYQVFFAASDQPWTGAPAPHNAEAFWEASERLGGS